MENRFKFRAWNKDFKVMEHNRSISMDMGQIYEGGFNITEHFIIMQSTGLKDKNDKLIYEGDILMPVAVNDLVDNVVPITVIWDEGSFCISAGMKQRLYKQYAEMFEIIGNIHQNPEMLEK